MKRFNLFVAMLILTLVPVCVHAGGLDDAPFKAVLPSSDWQLDDRPRPVGDGVSVAASMSKAKTVLTVIILKTALSDVDAASALNQLCAGINESFKNPAVKELSETDTSYLGFKARKFAYEVTQTGHTVYSEAMIFVAGDTGWSIAATGPLGQKDEIGKVFDFFRKR